MSVEHVPPRKPYPRLRAPVYFTPLGLAFLRRRGTRAGDDGMCVYTDEEPKPGAFLAVEVFLRDGGSVTCRVQVDWVEPLPPGAPARYDVGLRFTSIDPHDRKRLSSALEQA